jgi:hypothetical protein
MNAMKHEPQNFDTGALNTLLRGEMSAVETYTQALGKFDDQLVIADLQKIRDEHSRAVRELRDHVVREGGVPPTSPGPNLAFSSDTGGAKVIGPATALAALRLSEEHEACEYEAALESADVPADCRRVIRTDLLPACHKHVDELNRLLGGMNH